MEYYLVDMENGSILDYTEKVSKLDNEQLIIKYLNSGFNENLKKMYYKAICDREIKEDEIDNIRKIYTFDKSFNNHDEKYEKNGKILYKIIEKDSKLKIMSYTQKKIVKDLFPYTVIFSKNTLWNFVKKQIISTVKYMVLFIVIHEIFLKINNHGKGDNYVNFIIMSLIILVVLQLKNIINTPILLSKIKLNEKIEMTDEKITISSDNDEIFDCNWENVNIQEIEYFKYKGKKTMNGFTLVNEGNKNEIYQISFNIFIFDEVIGTILSKLIEKKKIILSI